MVDRRSSWFRHFELSPSSGRNIDALDGLRACAVLAIFLRHAWGIAGSPELTLPSHLLGLPNVDLTPFVAMSSNGVDLFFVLSGYLLSKSFLTAAAEGRAAPNLRRYFRSRAYRILPAYWVALATLVFVFLPALVDQSILLSRNGLAAIVAHVFLLQTSVPAAYGLWGPGSPYWTLTLEVLFYAALPFVARYFVGRRAVFALVLSFVVSVVWLTAARFWFGGLVDLVDEYSLREGSSAGFVRFWMSKQLPGYAFSFGMGIAIAQLAVSVGRLPPGSTFRRWVPVFSFLTGVAIIAYSMRWLGLRTLDLGLYDGLILMANRDRASTAFYYLESLSMAVGFGLILAGIALAEARWWTAPFRWKPLRLVGILGFSIYLWHMPFLYLYSRFPGVASLKPMSRWWALMGLAGVAIVAVSLFSFFWVEKPMIERGRRVAQARE